MKQLFIGILLAVFVCSVNAQTEYIKTTAKLPAHPRLLMLKGEEGILKQKINKDAYWKEIHQSVLAECDEIMGKPLLERIKTGMRLLSVSNECLRRAYFLGYAYRMTGQKKYAARLEKDLLACANFSDWNPSHFLDVGEMTMALAVGYDWLYSYLSPASRETIRTAIIEKGMKASLLKDEAWYQRSENNWNQVCNAGITYGALAVFEDCKEFATDRINLALNSIQKAMGEYVPDGNYPEGPGYWGYGTTFNVFFLAAIEKVFKTDFDLCQKPGFLATGMYSQMQISPTGYNFNFSDNGAKAGFSPAVYWFYSKVKNPALLYMQKYLYETGSKENITKERATIMGIIYGAGSEASLANPEIPSSLMWTGRGRTPIAVMRSGWTPGSNYLAFKAGSAATNHAHMDVGSFIFEADGIRWAYDFGSEDYNRLETRGVTLWSMKKTSQRWDVYKYRTTSHNTLSFNDKPMSVETRANLDDSGNKDGVMYAMSDLSEIYKDQIPGVKRAVSLVDGKYAVIQDQFTTNGQFTKVRSNLLTCADKITKVNDTTALLEKDGKRLFVRVDSPVPVRFYMEKPVPTNTYDTPITKGMFIGFEADLTLNTTQEIKVYLMPGENMNNVKAPYKF